MPKLLVILLSGLSAIAFASPLNLNQSGSSANNPCQQYKAIKKALKQAFADNDYCTIGKLEVDKRNFSTSHPECVSQNEHSCNHF